MYFHQDQELSNVAQVRLTCENPVDHILQVYSIRTFLHLLPQILRDIHISEYLKRLLREGHNF